MASSNRVLDKAFQAIAIDDDGRACRDIPDSACRQESGNFFTHVAALGLSKTSDGLIDPKLVLSWLMTHLAAPTGLIGLLVPIREAGALLPQLFTAGALRKLPQRKWAWSAGAFLQGLSAAAIGIAALTLSGALAGWAILTALTVLALARSVCSVCYKDVLGKTVDRSRRGRTTGLASSLAAGTTIIFAGLLVTGWIDRFTLVVAGLFLAGGCWMIGAALFIRLTEHRGATEGGASAFKAAVQNLSYLRTDPQLQRFILTRGLLTATALAPPFLVAATGSDGGYAGLGFLVLASALASLTSSWIWGSLSDQSSRKVLIRSAGLATLAIAAASLFAYLDQFSGEVLPPLVLFILMIAYQGVRLGRSTHLVDMATEETRAAYTALSNTVIGVLLLLGGGFSLLAAATDAATVLGVMAIMCAIAVPVAFGLEEVQAD